MVKGFLSVGCGVEQGVVLKQRWERRSLLPDYQCTC